MTEPSEQILLIDLENCQGHVEQLMEDVQQFSKVMLCYAKTSAKIPLDWLTTLSQVIHDGRLEIIKMSQVGKDSADFGLSFLAGRLSVQLSQPSHFVILSDDKALDYVIHLLKTYGHSAIRKSGKHNPAVIEPVKTPVPAENPVKNDAKTNAEQRQFIYRYCKILEKSVKKSAYPKTKTALLNSIKSFTHNDTLAKKIFHYLITSSAIKINADEAVVLNMPKLETLAKQAE